MKQEESVTDVLKPLHKDSGKLYLLCVGVGVITGFIVSLYRLFLYQISAFRRTILENSEFRTPKYIILIWLIFITIGVLIEFLLQKYPKISGSGIPQVKGILLRKLDYKNWFQELLAKFTSGLLGIGAGLSLGREGPSVQIGSYLGFGLTKLFSRDDVDKKYLVTSGATAGLAGAFGAPLSGVMFMLEELHKFISAKLLICAFLASIASNFVGRRLFGIRTSFDLIAIYPKELNPYYQFTLYIILGIILAFLGKLFTYLLLKTQKIYNKPFCSRWLKVCFILSTALLLCYILPDVTGGGHFLVEEMVYSRNIITTLLIIFIVKLFFTVFSYATGFAGGIFLPMLVLGAIIGKIYAIFLINYAGLPTDLITHFMVLAMAGYFVAIVRAPITGTVLILEMTGNFDHLLALATISIVAYYVTDLIGLEPIYDLLYEKMPKDINIDSEKADKKTIISIPVLGDSDLDEKKISEISWPEETLVVSIRRNDRDLTPKGKTIIKAGDLLILLTSRERAGKIQDMLFEMATTK